MIFLQATEKDYLKATRQTAKGRGGRTTSGAKFVANQKHGIKARNMERTKDAVKSVEDFKLVYTTK